MENSHTDSVLQLPSRNQKIGEGGWAPIPTGKHLLKPVSWVGWGVSSPHHPGLLLTRVPSSLWSPPHGAIYHCICAGFFLSEKSEIFLRPILVSKRRPHRKGFAFLETQEHPFLAADEECSP